MLMIKQKVHMAELFLDLFEPSRGWYDDRFPICNKKFDWFRKLRITTCPDDVTCPVCNDLMEAGLAWLPTPTTIAGKVPENVENITMVSAGDVHHNT